MNYFEVFKDKKILISSSNINLIVNKCSGDREALINELQKIEYFNKDGKKINSENITKLIRQLQELITSMKKIEDDENHLQEVSSWSP